MTLTCANPGCTEYGIAKELVGMDTLPPGIEMFCGACGQPSTPDDPGPEQEGS